MFVHDFLKTTSDGKIIIPPFHTGHLGFIPKTEVEVSLLLPMEVLPNHCEIIVNPFPQNFSKIAQLNCNMKDEPGVVWRLIDAVSDLGINIVSLESSIVQLNQHYVNMIFEWSGSKFPKIERTTSGIMRRYQTFRSLFPMDNPLR